MKPVKHITPIEPVEEDVNDPVDTPETTSTLNALIPDPNLSAAIRESLGIPPDIPVSKEDLKALKTLFAFNRGIVDLTGIENATNLTDLRLDGKCFIEPNAACRIKEVDPPFH